MKVPKKTFWAQQATGEFYWDALYVSEIGILFYLSFMFKYLSYEIAG